MHQNEEDINNNYPLKYAFILVLVSFSSALILLLFFNHYSLETLPTQTLPKEILLIYTLAILPFLTIVICISDLICSIVMKTFAVQSKLLKLLLLTLFGTILGYLILHYLLPMIFAFHSAPFNIEFWFPFFVSFTTAFLLSSVTE